MEYQESSFENDRQDLVTHYGCSKTYAVYDSNNTYPNFHNFNYTILNTNSENRNSYVLYSEGGLIAKDSVQKGQTQDNSKESQSTHIIQQRRHGRRIKNEKIISREENKLNRNSNKHYVNYKGVEVSPKEFIDYQCKCIKKCSLKLTTVQRKAEFEKYWALSAYNAQTAYIAAKVSEQSVKKRYGKSGKVKKDFSRSYSLCSTTVCRNMFCKTLQISSGRINTALTKIRLKTAIHDQRGIRKTISVNDNGDNLQIDKLYEGNSISQDCCTNVNKTLGSVNHEQGQEQVTTMCTDTNAEIEIKPSNDCPKLYHDIDNDSIKKSFDLDNTNSYKRITQLGTRLKKQISCNDEMKHTKIGRKRKFSQSRTENKISRNSNKPYINYKGVTVEPKQFIDYKCKCNKKCQQIIDVKDRHTEFVKFWTLPYNSQTAYIVAAVDEHPVKKRYSAESEPKRDYTRKYALCSATVCRDMFCRTLNISPGRINTALKKYRNKSALTDQRGMKQGGHNKLPIEKRNCVTRFLKRIPIYKSHYNKEKTRSRYLSPELTLSKLYELYKEEEKDNPINKASFKNIYYSTFNIRPTNACNLCNYYRHYLKKELSDIKKHDIKLKYDNHKVSMQQLQKYLDHDILLAKKYSEIECITFESEKVLSLPRIPSSTMYFKRLLWVHNLSIYSAKKEQGYCYVWSEGQAGKGAQEISSCLLKHIKEEIVWCQNVSHIILWTDPCGGLNRNMKLVLMLKCVLHGYPNLKSIKIKYLPSGHCGLPNQKDFCDIERALKSHSHLYMPEDYINIIRLCRKKKPLIVKLMNNQEFFSTVHLEKIIEHNAATGDGKVNMCEISEIALCASDPYTIYFNKQHDSPPINRNLVLRQDGSLTNLLHLLTLLWPLGKPISPAKLRDLKSMLHLIPTNAKSFYLNLQCGSNNDEDVDGLNENLDFDVEHVK